MHLNKYNDILDDMKDRINCSVIQCNSTENVASNKEMIASFLNSKPCLDSDCIFLPECCLFRPQNSNSILSERLNESMISWFKNYALTLKKWILIGSFFETASNGKSYNSSVLINPTGSIHAIYRKMHLFDVQVDDTSIMESNHFQSGSSPVVTQLESFKVGLSICYDIRFSSLYRYYSKQNCHILTIPSSFTKSTGQDHWHTLCKARAIESQSYVIAPNQCGLGSHSVETYGHSLIIDPWGTVLAEGSKDKSEVITADIRLDKLLKIRDQFPSHTHHHSFFKNF